MRMRVDFPKVLFLVFIVSWLVSGINPANRATWGHESIVIVLAIPFLVWSYISFRLSTASYVLVFVFAMLHVLGMHYTYGGTPWGDWMSTQFGWERNHYDRMVHFLFGVLMFPVVREILSRVMRGPSWILRMCALAVVATVGTLYEIGEFVVGRVAWPEGGLAFLGFQGDVWDTQKDMLLQIVGGLISAFMFR